MHQVKLGSWRTTDQTGRNCQTRSQKRSPSLGADVSVQTSPSVSTTSQTGSFVAKHRCGHAVCADCYDNAIHRGWNRCTLCRKSGTTRRVRVDVIPNNDNGDGDSEEDLSVFIRPENAAVAAEPVASSSEDFVPRHAVVEHSIKRHRAKMEGHNEAIMGRITQLSIYRDEYDLHKRLLQVCFDEQATFHTPTTAAAAAAAEEPDDKDKESSSNDSDDDDDDYVIDPTNIIATYDNTADAAAAVTTTVKHTNHPTQLSPDNDSNDNDNSNTDNATAVPISNPVVTRSEAARIEMGTSSNNNAASSTDPIPFSTLAVPGSGAVSFESTDISTQLHYIAHLLNEGKNFLIVPLDDDDNDDSDSDV